MTTDPVRRVPAEALARRKSIVLRPVRSLAALAAVAGLVTAFALPGYAAWQPADVEVSTLQQVASDNAQSLVVASDSVETQLTRESYAATTQAEIDQKKAAEAAAERARASAMVASVPFDYSIVPPGNGSVRWPVGGPFTVTDRFGSRGGAHMGTDMVAAGGTPVYASLDGVVRISQDSYGGYGVTVVLESVLNGQRVSTVYPHMRTGSRQVVPGQVVAAGQLVGLVGSTGRSTANHLHFEVYIDGTAVDSLAWLEANAG
ncbi:M23 family metallopeptidase [Microbacterium sp. NPDC056003]